MMKVLSEERAIELTEKLLQNDKDIKNELIEIMSDGTEDELTFRIEMQSIMEETKAIAEEAKDAVENFELSDEQMQEIIDNINTYDKDTINEKLAQKKTKYSGTNAPTSNPNDYPGIGYGDTYYQRDEGRLYCVEDLAVHPASGTILNVYWKALPSSSDVDLKIEEYNESKKVNAEVKNYMDIHLEALIESELYPVGDDGKITIESARISSNVSSVSIYSYDSEGNKINTTFVDKNALQNLPMEIELNCEYFALFFAFAMGTPADIQVSTVSYQKMELAEKVEILEENMNLYDKSEVVDKKIQTAIDGIATAEGSEF